MPDATEWLVEYRDASGKTAYERFTNVNDAIPFMHEVLSKSQRPRLYRETPITLTIDVGGEAPVKSRRRKKEAKEGAAGPDAQDGNAAPVGQDHLTAASAGNGIALPSPASPVFPWTCEARFDGDPDCLGQVWPDPATHGHFCEFHLMQVPAQHRTEMHRLHGSRNRPVRVAHAG